MPAFTPTEPKLLDAVADAEGVARPVVQVATAANSFEGAGFPVPAVPGCSTSGAT